MALFDPREGRICIRIVYDGLARAGKTTNLRQLSTLLAAEQAGPLISPAEVDGRTLYFDWMQIHSGAVCGLPLACQVISVPGQVVLTERRRHLLATADVVVYVCDSARGTLAAAREALALVDAVGRDRHDSPALVVQANKQDQADALAPAEVLSGLGRAAAACIPAIACDGIGVVDTFAAAVRVAAHALEARAASDAPRVPVRPAETPRAIQAALDALGIDPAWAAEMLLEEASRAFAAAEAAARVADDVRARASRARGRVPTPRADVPSGHVWPALSGRPRLEAIAPELPDVVALGADGHARLVRAGFRLATSKSDRFADADAATHALVRAARERAQLGDLLAPDTILVVQPGADDERWLWTIAPDLPSFRGALDATRDPVVRRARLDAFGAAVAEALAASVRHDLALDGSLDSFALDGDVLRYVGPIGSGRPCVVDEMIERALRDLARDAKRHPKDVERFVEALLGALTRGREPTEDGSQEDPEQVLT